MMLGSRTKLSRRDVLRLAGVSTAGVALGVESGFPWLAAAAGTPAVSPVQQPSGTISLAMVGDFIPSFYPVGTWTGNQFLLYDMFYSTLVKLDAKLNVRGDLAQTWQISPDATTFTFNLHHNVQWHDGQPCTAKDVAFSFQYYLRDPLAAGFTKHLQGLKGAQDFMAGKTEELPGIQTPDDYTVILTLEAPDVYLIKALREPFNNILPQHILQSVKPEDIKTNPFSTTKPVGTGPYKFVKMVPDQYVQLSAFTNYFKGTPPFATVFQKILAPELVLAQLQSGELDLGLRLNPLDYGKLKQAANLNTIANPGVGITELIINNKVITDKRVRQAMAYGLDRRGMLAGLFNGLGKVLNAPPAMTDYPDLNPYPHDPSKAKQLLQASGWNTSKKIRLIYDTSWPGIQNTTPIIQQELGEVGFNVELDPLDTAAWTDRYRNKPDTWELAWGQGGTEGLDPDVSSIYYTNDPKSAIGFYTNSDLDAIFKQGRAVSDPAKRKEIYAKAAQIINEEVPVIYLWSPDDIDATNKKLQNVTPHPYAPETTDDIIEWRLA